MNPSRAPKASISLRLKGRRFYYPWRDNRRGIRALTARSNAAARAAAIERAETYRAQIEWVLRRSAPSITPSLNAEGYVQLVADGQYVYMVDFDVTSVTPVAVPVPAAVWLLLSGLRGLGAFPRKRTA